MNALAARLAMLIRDGFEAYHARFAAVTRRARERFQARDWAGARQDAVERIGLYDRCIAETVDALRRAAGDAVGTRALWRQVHPAYALLLDGLIDAELYKTFYNTLARRLFATQGVDAAIEFMAIDVEPSDAITHPVARRSYTLSPTRPADALMRVLGDYRFDVPYAHQLRCAAAIAVRLQDDLAHWGDYPARSIELLDTVFYRERRAYLVGRVFGEHRFSPCVIALVNDDKGLRADAVLTRRRDVAHLFGVSRSYFQADLATVGDAVVFLRSLLPAKPIDEIYTVLGRAKQGKTERYRTFFRHFHDHPDQQLVHADGTPGMVMAVFTLPSYPLVFKLIRDRFAWPKRMTRDQVEEKYALVFNLDRVGRLLDAQPYRHLRFPRARFSPMLREELLSQCSGGVREEGDELVIALCYVQRRFRPLNLYLREQAATARRGAALDYAQAITDMACNNIFPGDMLPKNFGVSRHGRAVFYDYDELCLVTDCNFRAWPAARDAQEALADEPWFEIGPRDVFPERFWMFMGLPAADLAAVREHFGHLFDPAWWQGLQARFAAGDFPDTPPYAASHRLA
ncbi:bifunctional isocitrate dehydrogenase kinase/phosphatase [Stenotrophomonas rhizophila]|uniref:bifunctional isocitrate dehydrogenase kinase/phosphatase n=1 Tax=Stenotrophomonas rhizophila TaxID=216778 RepID=UPI001E4CFE35|nr:bifunctional isocitrate dehydrogenase kinase/phosphatase [Stenotrophomonas rhizophila]MCC7634275.1 bifunctional isocitrate dehydrogenase kinase/phosphatase [Stenotrophomonas rhizophila]MCC7663969.1 bifunctional isocitrate dehydrogenase kinase/phosphatase [Stenotrophomonas rhizophila]